MSGAIHLSIRTPVALLFEGRVRRVRAEDRDGWFGLRRGRRDLVAILPPGLLLFEDESGEAFVALAGGLLDLRRDRCRVMARDAVLERKLEKIAAEVQRQVRQRGERRAAHRDVLDDLAREALRRLARAEPQA